MDVQKYYKFHKKCLDLHFKDEQKTCKKKNPYNVQNNQPSNKTTTAIILM